MNRDDRNKLGGCLLALILIGSVVTGALLMSAWGSRFGVIGALAVFACVGVLIGVLLLPAGD